VKGSVIFLLAIPVLVAACDDRVDGLQPVGGATESSARKERFVRRLYLDLTARAPGDAQLADAVARLEAGNTAAVRGELADELIASAEFAEAWVEELENRAFAGDLPENRYGLICGILRGDDPACMGCPPSADPCADCGCEILQTLFDERASLDAAAADFEGGATTSEIERRYGHSYIFQALGAPETTVTTIFTTFLGRVPGPDELRNGRGMIFGAILPGSPAGLLFHRHGRDVYDLVEIVFDSEPYREAVVDAVFLRYLGRSPTAVELAHFAGALDEASPDARPIIRAVVSSREYFQQ
jgi:hypothetical protein